VHLAAALLYITGLVLLFAAVAALVVRFDDSQVAGTYLPESASEWVRTLSLPIAALAAVGALAAIVIGRRVHKGRQWARLLVLVVSAVSLGLNGFMLFTAGFADPLTGLVLPVLYLALLNTRAARHFFAGRAPLPDYASYPSYPSNGPVM
jgi:hypothetical protein